MPWQGIACGRGTSGFWPRDETGRWIPRRGCPPKLGEDDLAFLRQALERSPQDYGLLVTVWSIRELQALVQRERGIEVSVYTLRRVVHALGYRYPRPRHDLRHRQEAEAVSATQRVLDWLQKNWDGKAGLTSCRRLEPRHRKMVWWRRRWRGRRRQMSQPGPVKRRGGRQGRVRGPATQACVLSPVVEHCPACGQFMRVAYLEHRTVARLDGV